MSPEYSDNDEVPETPTPKDSKNEGGEEKEPSKAEGSDTSGGSGPGNGGDGPKTIEGATSESPDSDSNERAGMSLGDRKSLAPQREQHEKMYGQETAALKEAEISEQKSEDLGRKKELVEDLDKNRELRDKAHGLEELLFRRA